MTRLDWLLSAHSASDGGVPAQAYEDAAWAFVSAGGVVGPSEYAALDDASRGALRAAQARLWAERVGTIAELVRMALVEAQEEAVAEAAQSHADGIADSLARGNGR